MTIGWIGGGGNGGLTLNAIVSGMGEYLRISRPKKDAWGGGGATLTGDRNDAYGGNPTSTTTSQLSALDFSEVVPQLYIPVEVDCELNKADILADSICITPLSGRKQVSDLGVVEMDVNAADYYWWVEQWRNNQKIGQIIYKFPASGEMGVPNTTVEDLGIKGPDSNRTYGLLWFQSKTDSSKKTLTKSSYINYDYHKHLISNSNTVYVYPDTKGELRTSFGSAKTYYFTDTFDNGNGPEPACIIATENESDLNNNIRGIVGSTANFVYDPDDVTPTTGSLTEGSVVTLRGAVKYRGDSQANYMVEMDATVTASGGVEFYISYSSIDVESPTGKSICTPNTDFDFDESEIYVKTSGSGKWVKIENIVGNKVVVATEVTSNATPVNKDTSFTIVSAGKPLYGTYGSTDVYYSGANGTGSIVLGIVPDLTGYLVLNHNQIYGKKHIVVPSVPSGFDLWMATSTSALVPGNSYPAGVVTVDSEGVVQEISMAGSPSTATPTTNTVGEQSPSYQHASITFNTDDDLGAFPDNLKLRKGDLISLRTTADVSANGELTPPKKSASRAYEMGCEIRLPINVL